MSLFKKKREYEPAVTMGAGEVVDCIENILHADSADEESAWESSVEAVHVLTGASKERVRETLRAAVADVKNAIEEAGGNEDVDEVKKREYGDAAQVVLDLLYKNEGGA